MQRCGGPEQGRPAEDEVTVLATAVWWRSFGEVSVGVDAGEHVVVLAGQGGQESVAVGGE